METRDFSDINNKPASTATKNQGGRKTLIPKMLPTANHDGDGNTHNDGDSDPHELQKVDGAQNRW